MFTAVFCFLGIAGFIVAGALCLSMTERAAAIDGRLAWQEEERPTWDHKAPWCEIRESWIAWYVQCQQSGTLKRRELHSWARTFALCSALCLIGVLMEVHFSQSISLPHILAGLRRAGPVPSRFQSPQARPSSVKSAQTTSRSAHT
jgi:hypothetical protein